MGWGYPVANIIDKIVPRDPRFSEKRGYRQVDYHMWITHAWKDWPVSSSRGWQLRVRQMWCGSSFLNHNCLFYFLLPVRNITHKIIKINNRDRRATSNDNDVTLSQLELNEACFTKIVHAISHVQTFLLATLWQYCIASNNIGSKLWKLWDINISKCCLQFKYLS